MPPQAHPSSRSSMANSFRMPPAGAGPFLVLAFVLAVVVAGIDAAVTRPGMPLVVRIVLTLVLMVAVGVVATSAVGSRTARFELSPAGLRVRGDLYGRLIPAEQLRRVGARAVDLTADGTLRPVARTMGTGLPSYQSGWFRLADGERALVYLTDPRRAVYVPTSAGCALLLSVEDPAAFVAAVRGAVAP
jgi:hypothetical protein